MGNEGDMTWRKSVQGRAAMLERLVENETHPFNGMVGAIGEPNRHGGHPRHLSVKIKKICVFEWE